MVDREMQVTGVPAERDQELAVTGVPAQETAPPTPASPFSFTEQNPAPPLLPPGGLPRGPLDATGAFVANPPFQFDNAITERDAQYVTTSLLMTDPSLTPEQLTEMSGRLLRAAVEHPELNLFEEFTKNPALAMAHSTDDYLKLLAFQEAYNEDSFVGALVMATREAYERSEGTIMSGGQLLNMADAARGEWESESIQLDDIAQEAIIAAMSEDPASQFARGHKDKRFKAGEWIQTDPTRDVVAALSGRRDGSWVWDRDTNLNITLTEGEGDDKVVLWDGLIRLDPGTEINDNADALMALIQAQSGTAHRSTNPDALPGQQTLRGLALQTVGGTMRFLERNGVDPIFRAVAQSIQGITNPLVSFDEHGNPEAGDDAKAADAIERESNRRDINITPERLIWAIATQLEGSDQDRIILAMGAWDAKPEDEKNAELTNARDFDQEEFLKKWRADRAERGILATSLEENVLSPALELAQQWDRGVHILGMSLVHTLDLLPGEHEGAVEALVTEGFDAFKKSYTDLAKFESFADFLGMEPGAGASWVNFGASLVFDPLTWVVPGGKASRNAMLKSITDESLAFNYVRSNRAMRQLVTEVVDLDNIQALEVLIAGGIRPPAARRLMAIARTDFTKAGQVASRVSGAADEAADFATRAAARRTARNSAIDDVYDILHGELPHANGGSWIPSGPATLQVRQGTLGFANVIKKFDKLSTKDRGRLYQLFARTSRSRAAPINEDEFVEWAMRQVSTRYPDNPQSWGDEVTRLFDDVLDPYYGNRDELAAAAVQKTQTLQRELDALNAGLSAEARSVKSWRTTLKKIDDQIKEAEGALVRATGDPETLVTLRSSLAKLKTIQDDLTTKIAEHGGAFDAATDQRKTIRSQMNRARDAEKSAQVPRDRKLMERWAHEFYDGWADDLGIPLSDIDHPFLPGVKMRQWDEVVADGTSMLSRETVDNLGPLGNAADIKDLRAIGVGARGWTPMPVSPMEMVAYGAGSARTRKAMLEGRKSLISRGLDAQQRMFVTMVLTNLVTPMKTNLDEVLRFWTQTGVRDAGPILKALVGGIPPVPIPRLVSTGPRLRDVRPGVFAGGPGPAVRKIFPNSSRARGAGEIASPFDALSQNWKVLKRGVDKDHWLAAERWVNGSLMEDPIFKEYARVVTSEFGDKAAQREAFKQWWDDTGRFYSNTTRLNGKEIDYIVAFDIMDESFSYMMRTADDAAATSARILEAAAAGEKISATNRSFWSKIGDVPGVDQASPKGIKGGHEAVFNSLYGTPGAYRGGVFFDYYYKEALNIYSQGTRILDAEALMATGQFKTLAEAQRALTQGQGNALVRQMVSDQGYRMARDTEILAARWARNRADDMMYQMGAVSMFGRNTQRLYPFGRAQTDFLDYWFRQATTPTQFQNPITGAIATPSIAGRNLPLNVRLFDRWSKIAAQTDPEGNEPAGSPGSLVRRFTFLPTQFDESFLLDVIPSPAPLASWMVNFLPDEAGESPMSQAGAALRDAFAEVHPSHQLFSDYSNWGTGDLGQNLGGAFNNFVDSIAPRSGRSVRTQIEAVVKYVLGSMGTKPEQLDATLNAIVNGLITNSESPYYRDYISGEMVGWLGDNAFRYVPSTEGVFAEQMTLIDDAAFAAAYKKDGSEVLKTNVAIPSQFGSDREHIRGYVGIADTIDGWLTDGLVSQGQADEFRLGYQIVSDFIAGTGEASSQDKRRFADIASDIFNNALTFEQQAVFAVDHPEIVVNLVSGFEVDRDLVPQNLVDDGFIAGGRIVSRTDTDGNDLYVQGFDGGWLKTRDTTEIKIDMVERVQNYARTFIRDAYEEIVGQDWSSEANMGATLRTVDVDSDNMRRLAETLEIEFPDGALSSITGNYTMTLAEFRSALKGRRDILGGNFTIDTESSRKLKAIDQWHSGNTSQILSDLEESFGWDFQYDTTKEVSHYGTGLVQDLKDDIKVLSDEFDWNSPSEWEDASAASSRLVENLVAEDLREEYRQRFRVAISLSGGEFTLADYNRDYARDFGDINYEDPDPPEVADLDKSITFDDPRDHYVYDGDTIHVYTADDTVVPFRLLGINSPEEGEPGFDESKTALKELIANAETVTLGVFDPGRYGTTQVFRSGQGDVVVDNERVFVWLYVDGVPVFDPDVFTSINPRGVSSGEDDIPDYIGMLDRARTERGVTTTEGGEVI